MKQSPHFRMRLLHGEPRKAFALALGVLASFLVHAQPPDAGSLRQQYERERELQLPRKVVPAQPAESATLKPTGQTVVVKTFRFVGNTLLSDAQLAPVVAGYLNRPLDFNDLQDAAAAVATAFRKAGWTVQTVLPNQDITDGVVSIQIIEAFFGNTRLEGNVPTRIKPPQVLAMIDAAQQRGQALNADALGRALLLADDLPGLAVSGSLIKGAQDGATDLILQLSDKPLLLCDAGVDNAGARSTGAARLSGNATLQSPFGIGEQIDGDAVHTQGSNYLRLGASMPVGPYGWRVGANASSMTYRLITSEFSALGATGSSSTLGLEASYPIVRTRQRNLYLGLNVDRKHFDNQSNGATTTRYDSNVVSVAANGNLFDDLGGGGANRASLVYMEGKLNLNASPNQAADASTTQTAGNFGKWRYLLSRTQVVSSDMSLYAQWSGQLASKNLDSSEKFYLGGPSGLRAYPANEGGGSEGRLLNLELRWRLPQGLMLAAFYDRGTVVVNRNNSFSGSAAINKYDLGGGGLALSWGNGRGTTITATWARRAGDNPNPSATGNDQDGSLVTDRIWLSAKLPL